MKKRLALIVTAVLLATSLAGCIVVPVGPGPGGGGYYRHNDDYRYYR